MKYLEEVSNGSVKMIRELGSRPIREWLEGRNEIKDKAAG